MKYGYARISTPRQSITRQIRNILLVCPEAIIKEEIFTGTKFQGRGVWQNLKKTVRPGDTIYFDSVSRMSRNAEEGFEEYQELYSRNVNLCFLKEPHINTEVYRKALSVQVAMTGTTADYLLEGVNNYLMALAKEQIRIAFEQAEKEVTDLQQRTREGIVTAKLNGKQIGQKPGIKLTTKKSVEAKAKIQKHSKAFGGSLSDSECIKICGISRNSYYKYKAELTAQMRENR